MDPAQEAIELSAPEWSAFLTEALGNPVVVTYGHARRQVVQSKGFWKDPRGKPIEVRLSRFFQAAPREVQDALATWLRHGRKKRRASELLDAFIDEGLRSLPPKKTAAAKAQPEGLCHSLTPLAAELVEGPHAEFLPLDFAPRGLPVFTWGRRQLSRARRSLQLGSYTEDSHRIRLHTVLDQEAVPRFFLRYVLFHELLHAWRSVAAEREPTPHNSRRLHHDAAFRKREAHYRDFDAATAWQKRNISGLLRSARTGKPLKPK